MPRIKKEFIERLLERVDIVDVIGSRIKLKKSGTNYSACCPFHNEKTPSFGVNQRKQYFNCFGCHEAGTAITFIQKYDNISFVEAVEEVASIAGIDVEYEENNKNELYVNKEIAADYYFLMDQCVKLYQKALANNKTAQDYLSNRGISKETIDKYQIGFAPNEWEYVKQNVGKNDPNKLKALHELGMIKTSESGKVHDMFRNRVIIPIRDKRGRTIAFGGRVLDNSKPKYINSTENPIYSKGRELFNLDYVRKVSRNQLDRIIITEGYMDVISLDQHGVCNAVASLGTATTIDQISLLFKNTNRIVFCYDGDSAGRNAAWRALTIAIKSLQDGRELSFIFLPPEHDPDTLVREMGADGFNQYLDKAMSLSDYIVSELAPKHNLTNDNAKNSFLNEIKQLISAIDAPITKENIVSKVAPLIGWPIERVKDLLTSTANLTTEQKLVEAKTTENNQLKMTNLRLLVAFLIQNPFMVNEIPQCELLCNLIRTYADKSTQIVPDLIDMLLKKPNITTAIIVERYRDTPFEKLMKLLAEYNLPNDLTNVNIMTVDMLTYIQNILKKSVEDRLEFLNANYISKNNSDPALFLEYIELQKLIKKG